MSTFEREGYRWCETYFVLFASQRRPTISAVEHALTGLSKRFQLVGLKGNAEGQFESVTLLAPEDFAAVDVCYVSDEDVVTEAARLAKELKGLADRPTLSRVAASNARFDVLHFEQVQSADDDDLDEQFDPSALLLVLEALAELVEGVSVDPASGMLV
jgi:hypothetical protein